MLELVERLVPTLDVVEDVALLVERGRVRVLPAFTCTHAGIDPLHDGADHVMDLLGRNRGVHGDEVFREEQRHHVELVGTNTPQVGAAFGILLATPAPGDSTEAGDDIGLRIDEGCLDWVFGDREKGDDGERRNGHMSSKL